MAGPRWGKFESGARLVTEVEDSNCEFNGVHGDQAWMPAYGSHKIGQDPESVVVQEISFNESDEGCDGDSEDELEGNETTDDEDWGALGANYFKSFARILQEQEESSATGRTTKTSSEYKTVTEEIEAFLTDKLREEDASTASCSDRVLSTMADKGRPEKKSTIVSPSGSSSDAVDVVMSEWVNEDSMHEDERENSNGNDFSTSHLARVMNVDSDNGELIVELNTRVTTTLDNSDAGDWVDEDDIVQIGTGIPDKRVKTPTRKTKNKYPPGYEKVFGNGYSNGYGAGGELVVCAKKPYHKPLIPIQEIVRKETTQAAKDEYQKQKASIERRKAAMSEEERANFDAETKARKKRHRDNRNSVRIRRDLDGYAKHMRGMSDEARAKRNSGRRLNHQRRPEHVKAKEKARHQGYLEDMSLEDREKERERHKAGSLAEKKRLGAFHRSFVSVVTEIGSKLWTPIGKEEPVSREVAIIVTARHSWKVTAAELTRTSAGNVTVMNKFIRDFVNPVVVHDTESIVWNDREAHFALPWALAAPGEAVFPPGNFHNHLMDDAWTSFFQRQRPYSTVIVIIRGIDGASIDPGSYIMLKTLHPTLKIVMAFSVTERFVRRRLPFGQRMFFRTPRYDNRLYMFMLLDALINEMRNPGTDIKGRFVLAEWRLGRIFRAAMSQAWQTGDPLLIGATVAQFATLQTSGRNDLPWP
ncbi:hypothetical protein ACHAP3_011118 [Botrytis cinerea]